VLFHLPNIRGEEVLNTMGDLAYVYGEGAGWEFLSVDLSQSGDHNFGHKMKLLPALYFYTTYNSQTVKEVFEGDDMGTNGVAAEMTKFQLKHLQKRLSQVGYIDDDDDGGENGGGEAGGNAGAGKGGAAGGAGEEAKPKTAFYANTAVLELDVGDIQTALKDPTPIIIEFYAPWCGQCQSLKANYAAAADNVKRNNFPVRVASMDCDDEANKEICQQFGVQALPTIVYREAKAEANAFKVYEGERTEEAFYKFAVGLAGDGVKARPVVELTDQNALQGECLGFGGHGMSTVCIIAFLPDIYEGGKSARNSYLATLKELAESEKASQDQGFLWTVPGAQAGLESTFGIEAYGYPSIVAYLPEKSAYIVYADTLNADDLSRFISSLRRGARFKSSGALTAVDAPKWNGEDAPALEEDEFSLEDLMGDD